MFEKENQNYYEVLDLAPTATLHEIRQAYSRAKAAYGKDSPASYSVFDEKDVQQMREAIEQAYHVLSNPEKRKEYDRIHGLLHSVDGVQSNDQSTAALNTDSMKSKNFAELANSPHRHSPLMDDLHAEIRNTSENKLGVVKRQDLILSSQVSPEAQKLIDAEKEFSGSFFKKIRETYSITVRELAEFTKINLNYLDAIESERFEALPAPVYLRGFIQQMSKALRLPIEKSVQGFMMRLPDPADPKNKKNA